MVKKALVLLNMGGARSKDELEVFLTNMFNDKNILTFKNDTVRSMLASLIVTMRLNKAWENYKEIGGASPLHELTDKLVKKLQNELPEYFITTAMRYTSPFSQTAIARIKDKGIKDIVLFPLYPQYSTTTTKSSVEDFIEKLSDDDNEYNVTTIEPFYKNPMYNKAVCNEIVRVQAKYNDFHLIFSAHGLPQKIVDSGDPYQSQLEDQLEVLKEKLSHYATNIKSINFAYQSKVGPMKWLTPSLGDMLKNFKGEKVIIYPISFIVDNSETIFELDIEYREIAKKLGVKEYKVCKCINDTDIFINTVKGLLPL